MEWKKTYNGNALPSHFSFHYNDVIMGSMAFKSPTSPLFTQPFVEARVKGSIKPPRHWPLCGNSPHKGPVTWKMFPFDDVIIFQHHTDVAGEWMFRHCGDGFLMNGNVARTTLIVSGYWWKCVAQCQAKYINRDSQPPRTTPWGQSNW